MSGLPEGIIDAWEAESKHRRVLEVELAQTTSRLVLRGQASAVILTMLIFLGAMYLVFSGHGLEGMGVVLAEIVALVSIFLYARRDTLAQEATSLAPSEDS
jgi:hypothetical protein